MEVVLLGSEGLPSGSVLSIKYGDVKRQAPAGKIGQPFRFSNASSEQLLSVEILVPAAEAASVTLDSSKDTFEVAFGPSMKVELQYRELQLPTVDISNLAVSKDSQVVEKLLLAQQAAGYLEEHDLIRTFQSLLHGLLVAKPENPHEHLKERFAALHKKADDLVSVTCGSGVADSRRLSVNDRKSRRSTVRTAMRDQKLRGSAPVTKGDAKVDSMLMTLQAASDNLPLVMPFLPKDLRDELSSAEFAGRCEDHFRALDKEDRGVLTSDDLLEVLVLLSQATRETISSEQCRKFADMFDTDQDGLIGITEFTTLVQFVSVSDYLESKEGRELISTAMVQENNFQDFIKMIEVDRERLWSIVPFLPEDLVEHLTGTEFEEACNKHFDELDVDKSCSLEPHELIPVIKAISEGKVKDILITDDKCKQFAELFDSENKGSIVRDEFIEFVQFLTVMHFLSDTAEGKEVAERAEFETNRERTLRFLDMLESDPLSVSDILPFMPKAFVKDLMGDRFANACSEEFRNIIGESIACSLSAADLKPALRRLCKDNPSVSETQIHLFMKLYLKEKSSVTESEFLFLARYVLLLAFLTFQKENEDALTADVLLGEDKLKKFLSMLKKGSDSVWEIVSFLPQDLIDELTSDEFLQMCKAEFAELDKDQSGSLEPKELMPVILAITEVHKFALSERHCSRFVDIFDTDKNGVISSAEFADFVRFMVIMAFLETEEGQAVSLSAEAKTSSKSVDQLLDQLSSDRRNIHKVLAMLPDAVYERLASDKFIRQCREQFERLDEEKIGALKPYELHQVIVEMTSAQPFAVSEAQCVRFTKIFDHSGDGLLSLDEFLDFARFLSVMSYLQSDEGKAACGEALTVMDDAKKIEDLINELKTDKQKLTQVMPYLPSEFRKELLSDHFTNECISFFRELDKDESGSLDPQELFPVILSLADVHKLALDTEQCQRFANIFDENGDRLIELDEFVSFSRFIIVLGYLHSKEGGELMLDAWDEDIRLARPEAPEPPMVNVPSDLPTELDAQELDTADVPAAAEHLAVDCEFYKNKSEKLSAENLHLRERMNTLEELIRKMQVAMEEQEHKLLHAQVDLRASTTSLR